ncbi:Programmed cell death 6-interacting protein [Pseudolycoriella hygida]|uniref:Programmed cell death 6-interacting protein n=1 Tax=Pseudolycoriella hygida TaxID=35572 RepID=A0A9Q0RZX4_9DIPT|nr:Programmed cell death 6-interacting protein [Pseudolycoriella hygida]
MSQLLVVPPKKPSEVNISPLNNLIQSAYNSNSPGTAVNYSEAVNEFGKLRNVAIWKFFEKHEGSLEVVYGYYDQLCALETKIPVNELQIPFKWKDAFDKGSLFVGRMSLTLTSLAYEKVCVLFNIAALQSAVAAAQSVDSDEGLKLATKLFQQSAGIFNYLKGVTPAAIPQEPTPDLNPDTLQVLSSLMIAQAQEIFIVKAIRDNMKDAVIAKLACQCDELYAEALRGLQKDSLRAMWEKEWIPTITGKQQGFQALAQLYQSLVCRSNKSVGEEISRLQYAVELFKAAQSRSGHANLFEEYAAKAQRNLVESKKDNDFIYNEIIPDVKSLPSPGKALLAKPTVLQGTLSSNPKDLFEKLVPVALHQAMTACETRKNEFVNSEIMKLRESTQMLNSILASLNLPAAIEVNKGCVLPPSLLEKAEDVRKKGGIEYIRSLITELPELLKRNREILDVTDRMLDEEAQSDKELREQFKQLTRTPSDKLTVNFRSNAAKYREIINNAVQADKVVRDKFDQCAYGMEMLSKSAGELETAVPTSNKAAVTSCSSIDRLKQLMESVATLKAERDVIESELKSATVNMKSEFLEALSKDGAINEPALSVTGIGKILGPLQNHVKESIQRQETLVLDIQSAHKSFVAETGAGTGSRDAFFTELAKAYASFIELENNLKEGTKFYNDLTQLLVALQNKVSDYCFARQTEKKEFLKDLTSELSNHTPAPPPTAPANFGSANTTPANAPGSTPYPTQMQGMPMPYGASAATPYPSYVPPPMPQGFNPYATLPYPSTPYNYQSFPQGPQQYGTYPGSYAQQQQQQQPPPGYTGYKPPGW